MELGTYQLQVFISLLVILAAAGVALICDFLKGNNERLRELTVELKVRREEEERRIQMLLPQLAVAGVANGPVARVIAEVPAVQSEDARVRKVETPPARPRAVPREAPKEAVAKPMKRAAAPEALAAMARGAQLAGTRPAPVPQASVVLVEAAAKPASPAANGVRKNWGSLLETSRSSKSKTDTRPNGGLLEAVVAETSTQSRTGSLPPGIHDRFVLNQLIQKCQPVSGLVVSVGVNMQRQPGVRTPAPDVRTMIQSLLDPVDFAVESGVDEFLLVFPNERGASAQRRLSKIAEQLWDFQLRSLGTHSVRFSWGGVEVRGEPIDDAIASANERMQESKRSRKVVSIEPRALRAAV